MGAICGIAAAFLAWAPLPVPGNWPSLSLPLLPSVPLGRANWLQGWLGLSPCHFKSLSAVCLFLPLLPAFPLTPHPLSGVPEEGVQCRERDFLAGLRALPADSSQQHRAGWGGKGRRKAGQGRAGPALIVCLSLGLCFALQLACEARSIYQEYLSSQALSPVNIDRQAWLGEEVLAEPRPDMFRAPQLQVRGGASVCGRGLGGACPADTPPSRVPAPADLQPDEV